MIMDIRKYVKEDGQIPIDQWLQGIRDSRAKARILVRLDRLRLGLLGDHKAVGEGVQELRISDGKGYRVYYGFEENEIILLLCGGSKATQRKDIKLAKAYWKRFREEKHYD